MKINTAGLAGMVDLLDCPALLDAGRPARRIAHKEVENRVGMARIRPFHLIMRSATEIVSILFFLFVTALTALADGKMFVIDEVPADIPYQRALILFKDGTETLVLQSKYEFDATNKPQAKLGWVLPVPAPPEIASMRASDASGIFRGLSMTTSPKVTHVLPMLVVALGCGSLLAILLTLVLARIPSSIPMFSKIRKSKNDIIDFSVLGMTLSVMGLIIVAAAAPAGMKVDGVAGGVDVISQFQAGIYNVQVIRSDDSKALISWLDRNHFRFGPDDRTTFDSYIACGWCFVVAKIRADGEGLPEEIASEGLVAPLILRFPSKVPTYPLALTATGGFDTEVLIYIVSDTRVDCGGRIELRYAKQNKSRAFSHLATCIEPENFFEREGFDDSRLCKFRGRLTPGEMREDLVFTPSKDQSDYREHSFRW